MGNEMREVKKKISGNTKRTGIRFLKLAAIFLAVVSWHATAQGLISFVFKDGTAGIADGVIPKEVQAYLISFGIQAILFTLNLRMPQFMRILSSWGKGIMIAFYTVCLCSSAFFSFISFSDIVYERTQYVNSDITLRQQFQTTLSETEQYILECEKQLLVEIRTGVTGIIGDVDTSEPLNEIKKIFADSNQLDFYSVDSTKLEADAAQITNMEAYKDILKEHPVLNIGDAVIQETERKIETVNQQMKVFYEQLEQAKSQSEISSIEADMKNWISTDFTDRKETGGADPTGEAIRNAYYDAVYNAQVKEMKSKIEYQMLREIGDLGNLIDQSSVPAKILTATIEASADSIKKLNTHIETLLEEAMKNPKGFSNEDLFQVQQLKLLVEQYIQLDSCKGTETDSLTDKKTIWALKNDYMQQSLEVPGQEQEEITDEGVKNWRKKWTERLTNLEEVIRSLPSITVDVDNVDKTADSSETGETEDSYDIDSTVTNVGINKKLINEYSENMQQKANELIASSRTYLSDVNPIERYWSILWKGPYRGMAWFAAIAAVCIDGLSLLAGIGIYYIVKSIKAQPERQNKS